MMRSTHRTAYVAAFASLLIAAAPVSLGFGDRVAPIANEPAPYASADFDGDGAADTVTVVSVAAGKTLPGDVTVVPNLWASSSWHAAQGTKRALAIVVGKDHRKFLIVDPDYFDTPIWTEKQLPLAVAKRGSKDFKYFQSQEKHIKNDVLVLGTEAGIDTALYWDGKSFELFEPNEEP
jgi:hypothetical protein